MKFLKTNSLLALSLIALSSICEGKFAPATFVGKKVGSSPNERSLDSVFHESEATSSKSNTFVSSLSRLSGGSTESVTPAFTYYMDVFWTGLVAVFMVFWLMSMQSYQDNALTYVDEFPNFNKQVLVDGFCLAQDRATTLLGLGTLKLCGIVDLLLVTFSYFKYKDSFGVGNNKLIFYAAAGYTLIHGAIHGFEFDQSGQLWSSENSLALNIAGVVSLALVTAFTPVGIKNIFDEAEKAGGLFTGIAVWIGLIAFYCIGIKEKVFALTFINVTIFLSIFGARVLVFPKDDEKRLGFYIGKSIMPTIIAATANIIVMCFEPLVCKDWFASVGGHIWFDVSLWLFLMSTMK